MTRTRRLAAVSAVLFGCLATPPAVPAAAAQAASGGIGTSDTITARATVQAIDQAARSVTLVGPAGNSFTVVAGPRVANLDRIKVGDTVLAHYTQSVAYVLSPPNTKAPAGSLTTTATTAPKGASPSGAVGARLVVTGLVVGLDPGSHTIQLVNPAGGKVVDVQVRSQAGLRYFRHIKVGDSITAVISQALAISIEPAS